jgi:enoyl-CoA hydratase/carnithine racemase
MDKALSTVVLEKIGDTGVARINFNRPEKRNALNRQLVEDILSAMEEIRADRNINVVITKGNGPTYCSGLDLYYLRALSEGPPVRSGCRRSCAAASGRWRPAPCTMPVFR